MQSIGIQFCTFLLLIITVLAEHPSSIGGNEIFASQSSKGIRYAGPIVYTHEKPPTIHFPPPPAVSSNNKGIHGIGKGKSVKYVPLPTHDLPILIYQSDIAPPLHVVSTPVATQVSKREKQPAAFNDLRGDYSTQYKQIAQESTAAQPSKRSKKVVKESSAYRTFEPHYSKSSTSYGYAGTPSYYSPITQTIKNFFGQASSQAKSFVSPASSRSSSKASQKSETVRADYSSLNEVYVTPKTKPKKASPLPHIIYTGHAPIHIFNQSPLYVPKSSSKPLEQTRPKTTFRSSYQSNQNTIKFENKQELHSERSYTRPKPQSSALVKYTTDYASHNKVKPSSSVKSHKSYSKPSNYRQFKSYDYEPNYEFESHGTYSRTSHRGQQGAQSAPKPNFIKPAYDDYSSSTGSSKYKNSSPQQRSYSTNVKKYTSAPAAFSKPPIIIYQGLYPPHHVFENQSPDIKTVDHTYTRRMSSDAGFLIDSPNEQISTNYWLPGLTYSTPTVYVSDLTSHGTAPAHFLAQSPVADASQSHHTSQHNQQFSQIASSTNNQDTSLTPISYSSIMVQSAGTQ